MLLTSVARVKNTLGKTSANEEILLGRFIAAASSRVQSWLRRPDGLQLKSRTVYFSPHAGQRDFDLGQPGFGQVGAYPVSSITSVKVDGTGLFEGDETELDPDDYLVDADGRTLILDAAPAGLTGLLSPSPKSLEVVFTAGLSSSGVQSTWGKDVETGGTFTVGKYLLGFVSGAVGRILSRTASQVVYESIAGVFEAERVDEYTTLSNSLTGGGLSAGTSVYATLSAASTVCLAESYPDITLATEFYIDYLRRNRNALEATQVQTEGELRSQASERQKDFFALPEIRDLLEPYRNLRVAA